METIKNFKSDVQGIDDLTLSQNRIVRINEAIERQDRFFKRLAIIGIGMFIALISLGITFGYFGKFV